MKTLTSVMTLAIVAIATYFLTAQYINPDMSWLWLLAIVPILGYVVYRDLNHGWIGDIIKSEAQNGILLIVVIAATAIVQTMTITSKVSGQTEWSWWAVIAPSYSVVVLLFLILKGKWKSFIHNEFIEKKAQWCQRLGGLIKIDTGQVGFGKNKKIGELFITPDGNEVVVVRHALVGELIGFEPKKGIMGLKQKLFISWMKFLNK